MKFADHDPNLRESDAHEVPSPHRATSRAFRVALTIRRIASRRLSRLMNNRRVRRSAASLSICPGGSAAAATPSATRLIPTFVPSPYRQSNSRRCSTAGSMTIREATEVKDSV
ncbi:hypothetical protein B0I32_121164 [Nonomuraea fuscirosea]|uniref:Uncharacterized protein n=1 Tax=Nonomuraea fuscirosea TaxID=1291556 RepID=A0A2T0MMJ3_9ACTN|nr:hypothetical protein B0I32_121164 [Nonomuraea fuscirosea]